MKTNTENKKRKRLAIREALSFWLVARSLCLYVKNLYTLVEATSLAYTVCTVELAALRALNDIGGVLKLPYAGASLHLSRMRCFSLWYCHF